MAKKCVHKGCGKEFTDENEPCVYHPGPPEFHEGQKGWKCCKPRVLTFDEFLEIPPCTTGRHSTVDDTPKPEPTTTSNALEQNATIAPKPISTVNGKTTYTQPDGPVERRRSPLPPQTTPGQIPTPSPDEAEDDDDEPGTAIPANSTCKRKACGTSPSSDAIAGKNREGEICVHHPGQPIFHEGSKGWTCCKKRVLDFDEFMKLPGCTTKDLHLFVGKKKTKDKAGAGDGGEEYEDVKVVRHDFYQTPTTVHASIYLKKIAKDLSSVSFISSETNGPTNAVDLKLLTSDRKRYIFVMPLYANVDGSASTFKILGTKLELTIAKAEHGRGWPVLRGDEKATGEIIQTGKVGYA